MESMSKQTVIVGFDINKTKQAYHVIDAVTGTRFECGFVHRADPTELAVTRKDNMNSRKRMDRKNERRERFISLAKSVGIYCSIDTTLDTYFLRTKGLDELLDSAEFYHVLYTTRF